jgi:hypothetical protein
MYILTTYIKNKSLFSFQNNFKSQDFPSFFVNVQAW